MKIEIETYKNQTIYYNDDSDKFECDITIEDRNKGTKRQSLNDVRKEIDSFIKANLDFKPFKIIKLEWNGKDFSVKYVKAIRSDGKFVVCDSEKEGDYKNHYDKKEMEKARTYNSAIVDEKKKLEEEYQLARRKYDDGVKALCGKLSPIDLSKYEHIINQ